MRSGACPTQADVARKLGVTRARVTQLLALLRLCREAKDMIRDLGDPLPAQLYPSAPFGPWCDARPGDSSGSSARRSKQSHARNLTSVDRMSGNTHPEILLQSLWISQDSLRVSRDPAAGFPKRLSIRFCNTLVSFPEIGRSKQLFHPVQFPDRLHSAGTEADDRMV